MSEDALMDFIPTRGSVTKRKTDADFIFVDYKSYKSKKNEKTSFPQTTPTKTGDESKDASINVFNIKKVKHEVVQFGMTGFTNKERKEARVELAIKLGAKPERRKCINYKRLKQQKEAEKEQLKHQTDFFQLGKNMGVSTAKIKGFGKKTKAKTGIINEYGVVRVSINFLAYN